MPWASGARGSRAGTVRPCARALAEGRTALAPFAADPELAKHPSGKGLHNFKQENLLPVPSTAQTCRRTSAGPRPRAGAFRIHPLPTTPMHSIMRWRHSAGGQRAGSWLRCLLVNAFHRFEDRKAAQALATFGDLVRKALDSLRIHGLETPAPKLLLVDEYQDTSKVQDAFLEALGAERIVRVGDVKQAIYGFRGGDPDLLRDRLAAAVTAPSASPSNFRSTPRWWPWPTHYVDKVWPQLDPSVASLDGSQEPVATSGSTGGVGADARAIDFGRPSGSGGLDLGLSREAGWTESLGASQKTRSRTRALLLKQRTRLPGLLHRLKAQGIQPYVVAKDGFWDSPGVRLVLAALEAVAHPERPIPCAALLRQVVGLTDAEIAALAQAMKAVRGCQAWVTWILNGFRKRTATAARFLLELRQASTQDNRGSTLRQGAFSRPSRRLDGPRNPGAPAGQAQPGGTACQAAWTCPRVPSWPTPCWTTSGVVWSRATCPLLRRRRPTHPDRSRQQGPGIRRRHPSLVQRDPTQFPEGRSTHPA